MALIAFCAMALVENVTNAQPVRREGGGKDGGREEGGGGDKEDKNKTKGLDTSSF